MHIFLELVKIPRIHYRNFQAFFSSISRSSAWKTPIPRMKIADLVKFKIKAFHSKILTLHSRNRGFLTLFLQEIFRIPNPYALGIHRKSRRLKNSVYGKILPKDWTFRHPQSTIPNPRILPKIFIFNWVFILSNPDIGM